MSQKLEALKARQAAELAAAIEEETAREVITAHLATLNLAVVKFHPHCAYAQYVAVVEPVEDLPAAIYVAEILNPVTIFKVNSSCCAFVPEFNLDAYLGKNKSAKTDDYTAAYTYQIDGLNNRPDEKELQCYVEAVGYTFRVDIPVKHDPDTYRDYKITFNRRGEAHREYCRLINRSGYFLKSVSWWSSQEHPNSYTLY